MGRQATISETMQILNRRRSELRALPHYLSSEVARVGITLYVSKITDTLPSSLEEGNISVPITIVKSDPKPHTMEGIVDK